MFVFYLNLLLGAGARIARRLRSDVQGATAVEYGLMIALIMLSIIGAVELVGSGINNVYNHLTNTFNSAS